jgi:hypothetical protein
MSRTRHPKIFVGKIATYPHQQVSAALEALLFMAVNDREREIREYINKVLPEARIHVEQRNEVVRRSEATWGAQLAAQAAVPRRSAGPR